MTLQAPTIDERVDAIATEVIRPQAADIDASGAFLRAALASLRSEGLLGLISAPEVSGLGADAAAAARVVERVARECASAAIVLCMHYAVTAVIEVHGPAQVRERIAGGGHLSTLAFSEVGSRARFWAPMGIAEESGGGIALTARKSWLTSAAEADSYAWSSRPMAAEGLSTLWLVPATATGLQVKDSFDGLGLRGNGSTRSRRGPGGRDARRRWSRLRRDDGHGPPGLPPSARLEHLDQSLAEQPLARANLGAMRVTADAARALWTAALDAAAEGSAAAVMAPTTEVPYDLTGRAVTGPPLFVNPMTPPDAPLVLGAVAYEPRVVTIWEGVKAWLGDRGLPFDYVLCSNYERLVESLLAEQVHAVAMRDTDCDLASVVVARPDSDVRAVADLRGRTLAVGALDSPQATLIPLSLVRASGLSPGIDVTVRHFDVLAGKHGDHVGGEREAALALMRGEVDAACMIEGNHDLFRAEGVLPPDSRVVARTAAFDHCNFTVTDAAPRDKIERFHGLLLSMSHDDPEVRPLLDLEGLRAWRPGRARGQRRSSRRSTRPASTTAAGAVTETAYRY